MSWPKRNIPGVYFGFAPRLKNSRITIAPGCFPDGPKMTGLLPEPLDSLLFLEKEVGLRGQPDIGVLVVTVLFSVGIHGAGPVRELVGIAGG